MLHFITKQAYCSTNAQTHKKKHLQNIFRDAPDTAPQTNYLLRLPYTMFKVLLTLFALPALAAAAFFAAAGVQPGKNTAKLQTAANKAILAKIFFILFTFLFLHLNF